MTYSSDSSGGNETEIDVKKENLFKQIKMKTCKGGYGN